MSIQQIQYTPAQREALKEHQLYREIVSYQTEIADLTMLASQLQLDLERAERAHADKAAQLIRALDRLVDMKAGK